jgi:hypothetical protein
MHLRLVLLCVNRISHGTQAILAETARTHMEGAIRRLARWRAPGWKNLPLSGSPRILSEYIYFTPDRVPRHGRFRGQAQYQILKLATYFRDRPRPNDSLHAL